MQFHLEHVASHGHLECQRLLHPMVVLLDRPTPTPDALQEVLCILAATILVGVHLHSNLRARHVLAPFTFVVDLMLEVRGLFRELDDQGPFPPHALQRNVAPLKHRLRARVRDPKFCLRSQRFAKGRSAPQVVIDEHDGHVGRCVVRQVQVVLGAKFGLLFAQFFLRP